MIRSNLNRLKKQELDEEQREEAEDHDIIQGDLVEGLLITGFLARLRYLLEEANIYTHAFMVFFFFINNVVGILI